MKKFLKLFLFLFISGTIFYACSDDDDDNPTVTPDPTPTQVTYSTVATIMSGNCNGCHGATPTNGAPMSLTTYTEVRQAVENRNLIGRIENGSMPPNGSLSTTQINNIKSWQAQGFPQ